LILNQELLRKKTKHHTTTDKRNGEISMNGINLMTLVGTVTQQPETRFAASGTAITNISVATNYRPKGGEEVPEFHRVVCFGRTAEVASEYLHKGSKCGVVGRLQTRSWEKDGVKRYSTEIVCDNLQLLDSKRDSGSTGSTERQKPVPTPTTAPDGNTVGGGDSFFDKDVPFNKVDGRYV
jgi:single-strand DNA-binding protein